MLAEPGFEQTAQFGVIGPGNSELGEMLVFGLNLREIWDEAIGVEQMIGVLKQAQVGVPVAEVIRKAGISEQTIYRWKSKYGGLEVDQFDRWHSCRKRTSG